MILSDFGAEKSFKSTEICFCHLSGNPKVIFYSDRSCIGDIIAVPEETELPEEQATTQTTTGVSTRRTTPSTPNHRVENLMSSYSPQMFNRSTLMWIIIITTLNAARILLSKS